MTLAEYMEAHDLAPGEMAARINAQLRQLGDTEDEITHRAVRKWRDRQRIPRELAMTAIFMATQGDVAPADWYPKIREVADVQADG